MATSLAKVCARVLSGVTWNTGKESLPSYIPLVDRMTEMKCMQVFSRSGREEDLVSNLQSTVEMLPTTFRALSTTASDETPSSAINARARCNG